MKQSLSYGAVSSLVGFVIGAYISLGAIGGGWEWFFLCAGAAAFLTSAALWHLLVVKKNKPRPIIAGVLSGLVSHPLTFFLMMTVANLCYAITGGCTSSLNEPPASWLYAAPASLAFSLYSLMLFGWVTAPAGAMIGYIFHRYHSAPGRNGDAND